MSKQTETLKLALEALKQIDEAMPFPVAKLAQKVIREALAEPAQQWNAGVPLLYLEPEPGVSIKATYEQPAQQQEPVAWMIWTYGPVLVFMNKDEATMEFDRLNHAYPESTRMLVPLYTFPPASKPWVGLTEEEVSKLVSCTRWRSDESMHTYAVRACRSIEAKLREKNT